MAEAYPPIGSGGASNSITSPDSESRELVAGTNITFDTATPGQLEISAAGGGGAGNWNFGSTETTQSGDYTILSTDRWIVYDGPGGNTWTLPASPTLGEAHVILNYGSGDLTLADPNGYSIGIQGDSVPISTSFGAPAPFVLVFSGTSNGSGSYQWLVTPADSMSFLPTLELIIAGEPNSAEVYSISGTTPAGGRNIQIRDPGVSATQLGLVANASIDDGNIPKWVAGPSTGGYLADSGFGIIGNGSATLVAGSATVSFSPINSSCFVITSVTSPGGTQGVLSIQNIVADTSFDIVSSNAADTSTVKYLVIQEPA